MQPRHLLAVAGTAIVASGAVAVAATAKPSHPSDHGNGHHRQGHHGHGHGHHHTRALDRIDLPDGYRPEGITAVPGSDDDVYVGSIPTGQVLRVDTEDGDLDTVVPAAEGRAAIGIKADRSKLYVSGGPTGKAFVYDTRSGKLLRAFQLAPDATTFINDVTLTEDVAYFTDSRRQAVYAVQRDLSGAREIATPDIPLLEGNNLNGIAATGDGSALLAVQSANGALWRIDPQTGAATRVDLGGAELTNGDGLLLKGHTLFVVQNRSNLVSVWELADDYGSGSPIGTITSKGWDVPTTITRQGRDLWVVNARFGNATPDSAEYWVSRVPRW